MECFHCKGRFPTIPSLVDHTRVGCLAFFQNPVADSRYRCAACVLLFPDIYGWIRHLNMRHSPVVPTSRTCSALVSPACTPQSFRGIQSPLTRPLPPPETFARRRLFDSPCGSGPQPGSTLPFAPASAVGVPLPTVALDPLEHMKTLLLRTFSSLHSSPEVTAKQVQQVAEILDSVFTDGISHCLDMTVSKYVRVNGEVCGHLLEGVNELKNIMKMSLHKFRSDHIRRKYFKSIGTLVAPEKVLLGPAMVSIGRRPLSIVTHSAQVIPVRKTLTRLLSIPGLMAEMDDHINACTADESLTNIINSPAWIDTYMSLSAPNTKVVPLLLYFDEFEVGNPLGSHAGIHKLGGVYISIPCLPPRLVSRLTYIFLMFIFHASDRVAFGNRVTFSAVIKELKHLATEGITVDASPHFSGTVKFAIAAIVGDNLGLHGMLGFVEGFTANYPCRVCHSSKEACATMVEEDVETLRNEVNYNADIGMDNVRKTGIKEKCVWLDLPYFDLFRNVGMDVMHDFYEGVAKYVLTEILNTLIRGKVFTLEFLNLRLAEFQYGPDSDNKPPQLSWTEGGIKIRFSASECLIFLRYFGMLVGHVVPEVDLDDPCQKSPTQLAYKLYVTLKKVEELIMTRRVSEGTAANLRVWLVDLCTLYMKVGNTTLKPKFHHLLHYPRMMLHFGPLCHLWSMRFEGRNRVGKKAAATSSSRVNICLTTAKRIQLELNDIFVTNTLRPPVFTTSLGIPAHSSVILLLTSAFPSLSVGTRITSHAFVTSPSNVTYRRKDVITVMIDPYDMIYPKFAEIEALFYDADTGECYAHCLWLETNYFDNQFSAYCVNRTLERTFIRLSELNYVFPNTMGYTSGQEPPTLMVIERNWLV